MNALTVTWRNLRLFFRDRAAVFFSILSALILIGLYALFLGHQQVDALEQTLPRASEADITAFVVAWVFAGVAMITTLTTGLSSLSQLVEDASSGRFRDFLVSPVRRIELILGYLVSSFMISVLISLVTVIAGQLYLAIIGAPVMTPPQIATVLGYLALSSAAFVAMSAFLVTFMRSANAFTAVATIVGTLIGFLAGAYIPPGVLPSAVSNVVQALPFSQSAQLIRQPLTHEALVRMTDGSGRAESTISAFYGMTAKVGDATVTNGWALAELAAVLLVFLALGAWRIGRRIR
ncbi:ABC transporter permease [Pseudolysinimonas sp.]|uniref:ABC transporter permease n=1 Tax=Pseudolysinimonas sp. TaxID=2680009 RepID=UPI003F81D9A9